MLDGVDWKISGYIENLIKEESYNEGNPYTTSYLVKQIQDKEASLLYYVQYLSHICEHINSFVKQSIKNKFAFISSKELNLYNNEKPLSLLLTHSSIKEYFNNEENFQYLVKKIDQFIHDIFNRTGEIEPYIGSTTCPLCGYNNNRLAKDDSVYKCPKCHHLFYNRTSLFTYNHEVENINEKEIKLLKEKISKLETELLISNQKVNKFEKGSLKYRLEALLKRKLPL
jgi:transposase-like protein